MMEQMTECLLAEIRTNQAKMDANQEKMEAKIEVNNEKFEVIQGALVSRMDIHQARTMSIQEEMKANMDIHQEKMEAAIHSIRSKFKTFKNGWKTSCCVNQKMQGPCKELNEKTEETQADLHAVKTSLNTRTNSLQKTPADMKNDLHEEAWAMKAEIRINQERIEANIEAT
jgi:hypothetical protein